MRCQAGPRLSPSPSLTNSSPLSSVAPEAHVEGLDRPLGAEEELSPQEGRVLARREEEAEDPGHGGGSRRLLPRTGGSIGVWAVHISRAVRLLTVHPRV